MSDIGRIEQLTDNDSPTYTSEALEALRKRNYRRINMPQPDDESDLSESKTNGWFVAGSKYEKVVAERDALRARLAELEKDEPITTEALLADGWQKSAGPLFYFWKELGRKYTKEHCWIHYYEDNSADVNSIHGSMNLNVNSMRDIRDAVRLFTPKEK